MKQKIRSQKPEARSQKNKGSKRVFILALTSCLLLLASYLLFSPLHAIEIPLDGLGEKMTKVAYVNVKKIFEAFPETDKARVELNKLIEEKRYSIIEKKEEIAKLKGEVEFLKQKMAAVSPEKERREKTMPEGQSAPQPTTTLEPGGATSLKLPEGSPLEFLFTPPEQSTQPAATELQLSTKPALAVSTQAPAILPGIPSPEPQIKEKEALLYQKETELDSFVGEAEEEIRLLEEGKTLTLMAKIYRAIEDVAAQEGYSVIVDKETILYGEGAADITQTVIWKLSRPGKK